MTGLLPGGGEMGRRIREYDWGATPLGPVDSWPLSLRTIVSVVYLSAHPMFLFWGPEHIGFYNDAYSQSLGPDRHPGALGRRGRETWEEIWDTIGPQIAAVMAGGDATWHEDQFLPITRGDRVDDVYWSYSYSPVPDDDGSVAGVLVTVTETTRRVLSERRLRLLQDVADREVEAATLEDVSVIAARILAEHPDDFPCGLIYLHDPTDGVLRLASAIGVEPETDAAPATLTDPDAHCAVLAAACGARSAIPVPITGPAGSPAGMLVAAINPRLPFDDGYRAFLSHLARELGTSLHTVHTREERLRAVHEAAAAERNLLAHVFELAPSFLAVLRGEDYVFELINPAYSQLIGHRAVIGRPLAEALPEAAAQGFVDLLDQVYRTGVPYVGNERRILVQRVRDAEPEERFLNFVYQAIRDAEGTITGIHVTGVDVTELVRQRQLVERESAEHDAERRQLLTVLEQSPLGILIIESASRRLRFSNAAARDLLAQGDRLPEDLAAVGASWRAFGQDGRAIPLEDRPLHRALATGEAVTNEMLVLEHVETGRRFEIAETAATVRDAQGDVIAGVVIFADVTAERQTERQLRDAERMQAVGTLAGGVAHEINNQMTAVLGFGSFVLRALGAEHPQSADMRLVLQSAERAARISQQLLAFTRQQVTQRQVLGLSTAMEELTPVLAQLLGSDKSLEVVPDPAVAPVYADPDQVQQVMVNLVANARDATETGDTVTISVGERTVARELPTPTGDAVQPGRYVVVAVTDTGQGMGRDVLSRIFDPFFTTKAVGKGSGLGMPMVYGTLRRHGGYVLVRSVPGAGTTVELLWPVATPAHSEAVEGAAEGARRMAEAGGATVLLAEDEPAVRMLAVRTLEAEGYNVIATSDGAEAAEAFRAGRVAPDIVITDVIMPRMNGRQLSDLVLAQLPDVPVVFMSGHTGEDAVLQRLIPPDAHFLPKPFTPDDLAQAAAAALFRRGR